MNEIDEILTRDLGHDLRRNVVLKDFVSLKVGGVADYLFVAKNIEDLVGAVSAAYKIGLPYFVLAGGYNVVPSDAGFPGLVIKNESANIVFSPDFSTVIVDSGVNMGKLINMAAGRDLGGLEFLFGVPGTVGGSIYGNAGAFGHEIGDSVKSVTMMMPSKDGKMIVERHGPDWLEFAYRSSKLKRDFMEETAKPVILTATLQLVQRRKDEILRMMQENLAKKKDSQPIGDFSAGSFFKNKGNTKEQSAGYMLDHAGAQRLRAGGAEFSRKHANFLINKKNATATDIRTLAEKAKDLVAEKYNVNLEEEVEYIGKW